MSASPCHPTLWPKRDRRFLSHGDGRGDGMELGADGGNRLGGVRGNAELIGDTVDIAGFQHLLEGLLLIEWHGADGVVEEAQYSLIERRIGQIERGEVQLIPGEEVFARLRRRLG